MPKDLLNLYQKRYKESYSALLTFNITNKIELVKPFIDHAPKSTKIWVGYEILYRNGRNRVYKQDLSTFYWEDVRLQVVN